MTDYRVFWVSVAVLLLFLALVLCGGCSSVAKIAGDVAKEKATELWEENKDELKDFAVDTAKETGREFLADRAEEIKQKDPEDRSFLDKALLALLTGVAGVGTGSHIVAERRKKRRDMATATIAVPTGKVVN